jgi:hypothetical protein
VWDTNGFASEYCSRSIRWWVFDGVLDARFTVRFVGRVSLVVIGLWGRSNCEIDGEPLINDWGFSADDWSCWFMLYLTRLMAIRCNEQRHKLRDEKYGIQAKALTTSRLLVLYKNRPTASLPCSSISSWGRTRNLLLRGNAGKWDPQNLRYPFISLIRNPNVVWHVKPWRPTSAWASLIRDHSLSSKRGGVAGGVVCCCNRSLASSLDGASLLARCRSRELKDPA